MKTYQRDRDGARLRAWLSLAYGALLCQVVLVAPAFAQDKPMNVADVASVTLLPLSNQLIATVKGGGLQGPAVGTSPSGGAIILWDELKSPAQNQNTATGTSTITFNAVNK